MVRAWIATGLIPGGDKADIPAPLSMPIKAGALAGGAHMDTPSAHPSPFRVQLWGATTVHWERDRFADAHRDGEEFHRLGQETAQPLLVTIRDRRGQLIAQWRTDTYQPLEVLPGVATS